MSIRSRSDGLPKPREALPSIGGSYSMSFRRDMDMTYRLEKAEAGMKEPG
jgi:hypothetical protein